MKPIIEWQETFQLIEDWQDYVGAEMCLEELFFKYWEETAMQILGILTKE